MKVKLKDTSTEVKNTIKKMSRAEKRKYVKNYTHNLRSLGVARNQRKEFAKYKLAELESEVLLEGDKVKIDYETITHYPDYKDKVSGFKESVEKLKDKVCTVIYDEKYKINPFFVSLEEDEHEPKWLFARTDLIKQINNSEKD